MIRSAFYLYIIDFFFINLKSLQLKLNKITNEIFSGEVLEYCPSLEELDLRQNNITFGIFNCDPLPLLKKKKLSVILFDNPIENSMYSQIVNEVENFKEKLKDSTVDLKLIFRSKDDISLIYKDFCFIEFRKNLE